MVGNMNGGQINPNGNSGHTQLIMGASKQKRTSSEDNVNVQMKMNANHQ